MQYIIKVHTHTEPNGGNGTLYYVSTGNHGFKLVFPSPSNARKYKTLASAEKTLAKVEKELSEKGFYYTAAIQCI